MKNSLPAVVRFAHYSFVWRPRAAFIGAALGVLGLLLDPLFSMLPLSRALGELSWSTSNEFLLVAIPLFIMLGEVLLRAGFAERMYAAMSLWLSWLPGGLMHK